MSSYSLHTDVKAFRESVKKIFLRNLHPFDKLIELIGNWFFHVFIFLYNTPFRHFVAVTKVG